jgi:hypothetical protein
MHFSKKAVVILAPSLLFGVGTRAWSASSDQAAPINAQVVPANTNVTNLLNLLRPVLTNANPTPAEPRQNCTPSQMYSQHDVVGDPESCLMGHYYGVGIGQTFAPGIVP